MALLRVFGRGIADDLQMASVLTAIRRMGEKDLLIKLVNRKAIIPGLGLIYRYICHGKPLPSNASLMVEKRVLQGEAWSDLSDSNGTHDLGDKFGDFGDK
ncbi:hypothetical protein AVEN_1815-1 [Araneus ventricosus]|uniref:Uncharacterized protein n=1 Tax=Araneus ventricosus TaxID=182803 RepID=A0A4Y2PAZ6_ARAVE|nr:hypothetical protein AVEN_1815-1 [Araneus ventricosus]